MKLNAHLAEQNPHAIKDLGWTRAEAGETRARLIAFAEDWNDASMDVYDTVILSAARGSPSLPDSGNPDNC